MTRALLIGSGAAFVLAACGGGGGDYGGGPNNNPGGNGTPTLSATVTMPGNSFSPFTTSIKVTGTVSFQFPAAVHNVIFKAATGKPADIQQTSNVTVQRTFNTQGTFGYDCTLHPGMSGEVVVVP